MAANFLNHPDLKPFELQNVRLTGRTIGAGAYGSVEEGDICGTPCAVKKIHDIFQDRTQIPPDELQRAGEKFVEECRLTSTLRHPHIVQFIGVCFLPRAPLPALVMERLVTSLHDLLETRPDIPLSLKHSLLHDVARGLVYLHTHSPPLIHGDLSARNVLLNSAMVAKIGVLGVARIMPSLKAAHIMTKAPEASVYMPPEAVGEGAKYSTAIDMFSFGVVTIFTLSQIFPKNVLPRDQQQREVFRNEDERREEYMCKIYSQFRQDHPFIQMIKRCLERFPEDRPTIQQVVELLVRAGADIDDAECRMDRLDLIQSIKEQAEQINSNERQVLSKNQEIQEISAQKQSLEQEVCEKTEQNQRLEQAIHEQAEQNQGTIRELRKEVSDLQEEKLQAKHQIDTLQAQVEELRLQMPAKTRQIQTEERCHLDELEPLLMRGDFQRVLVYCARMIQVTAGKLPTEERKEVDVGCVYKESDMVYSVLLKDGKSDDSSTLLQAVYQLKFIIVRLYAVDGEVQQEVGYAHSEGAHQFSVYLHRADVWRCIQCVLPLYQLEGSTVRLQRLQQSIQEGDWVVTTIDLRNQGIGDPGCQAVVDVLRLVTGVERLFLKANHISEKGAQLLAAGLKSCNTLQRLNLAVNSIGDEGVKCLMPSIKSCTNLTHVILSANALTDGCVQDITELVMSLKSLKYLLLGGNQFSEQGKSSLREVGEKRSKLRTLALGL